MRKLTVYRLNKKTGEVDKIPVGPGALRKREHRKEFKTSADFHQNVIDTYYELECNGEPSVKNMNAREKQFEKNVHTYAQQPGWWPDMGRWDEQHGNPYGG